MLEETSNQELKREAPNEKDGLQRVGKAIRSDETTRTVAGKPRPRQPRIIDILKPTQNQKTIFKNKRYEGTKVRRYEAIGTGDTELYIFAGMLAAVVISIRVFLFRGAGKAN